MRRDRRLAQWLLPLALLACVEARADWKSDYDKGLKAIEQQDWAEAERDFRAALRDNPDASERQRFAGMVFKPYLPQYYAGLAAWKQGRCDDALDYWQQPKSQSAVAGVADAAAEQARGIRDCQQRLAAAKAPSTAPATVASTPASTTSAPSAPTASSSKPASTPSTSVAQAAKPSVPPPSSKPAPVSTPAKPAASKASAPAVLVGAVEQYLAGRYGDLSRLDPAAGGDAAARAQLLLLRAAGRFLQAELDGNDGNAALDPARADVRAARAAQASVNPDPGMFPPRFVAFFKQTR